MNKLYCYDSNGTYYKTYNSILDVKYVLTENNYKNLHRAIKQGWKCAGFYWSYIKRNNFLNIDKTPDCNRKPNNISTDIGDNICEHIKTTNYRNKLIDEIKDKYSIEELKILAKGSPIKPHNVKPLLNFNGDHVKIGVIGDTHIGSKYTNENDIFSAFDYFKKEGVDFIVHTGDVTEGMSNRPGHIYELDYLGYEQQKQYAIKVFSQCSAPIYMIDGNHDRWYIKSNGAIIVKDICESLPNATYLGHDEGDIILNNNISIRLWHGEDGSSYATSYRIQKVVESLTGGDKPNVLFLGHVHKFAYIFERHIHCLSTGCLQTQTPWMRGKRLSAHAGFSVVDLWMNKKGVSRFRQEFIPLYH